MNYCRKCQSDYEKPGTCNCYAPQAAQPVTFPQIVYPPYYQPYWVYPVYYPQNVWGNGATSGYAQITAGDVPVTTITTIDDLAPALTYADAVKWGKSMAGGDTSHMVDS